MGKEFKFIPKEWELNSEIAKKNFLEGRGYKSKDIPKIKELICLLEIAHQLRRIADKLK